MLPAEDFNKNMDIFASNFNENIGKKNYQIPQQQQYISPQLVQQQLLLANATEITKVIGNYSYVPKFILGEGSFSKVFEGTDLTKNTKVAIKQVDLKRFQQDQYFKQSITQEIEIIKRVHHPNILQFIDIVFTERSIYIITEFCSGGDLRNYLQNNKLTESQSIEIMKQILEGFKELVKNNISHRDLKPANILVNNGVFKIADFGFAQNYMNNQNQLMKSAVGTPYYMAPQVLLNQPYTSKCDIWSFGTILYEIITGDVPYLAKNEIDLIDKIQKLPLKLDQIQDSFCLEVIKSCLVIDEQKRIDWPTLFQLFENQNKKLFKVTTNKIIKNSTHYSHSTNEQQKIMFQKQIFEFSKIREEIIYLHFCNSQIFQSILDSIQSTSQKPSILLDKDYNQDKAILILSIFIKQNSQNFISQIHENEASFSSFCEKQKFNEFAVTISNENEFYIKIVEDITNYCGRMGIQNELKGNPESKFLFQQNFNDLEKQKISDLFLKYSKSAIEISINYMKKYANRISEIDQQLILNTDLMIDAFYILKNRGILDIVYTQLFSEKQLYQSLDHKMLYEQVMKKYNKYFGGFFNF